MLVKFGYPNYSREICDLKLPLILVSNLLLYFAGGVPAWGVPLRVILSSILLENIVPVMVENLDSPIKVSSSCPFEPEQWLSRERTQARLKTCPWGHVLKKSRVSKSSPGQKKLLVC
ncbi:MAG: hypothetical protein LBF22_09290 [Deltaproteobacteria bacterium]|jgi:hypothetical protein|nr:hypothetical protein [Deltaproteobacteria bacterium]